MPVTPSLSDVNRPLLAAVAFVVLLAGCSTPGGSGDAGPTETVTPVPVTDAGDVDRGVATGTATPTPERSESLDGGAFADLLDTHARRIGNSSYAYRRTISGAGSDGAGVLNVTVEGYRGQNGTVYYLERTGDGGDERFWSNGTVWVSARETGNGTEYEAGPASRGRPGDWRSAERLRWPLEYARPTTVTENGTHYRIEAEFVRKDGRSVLGPRPTLGDSTLSMTVTRAGLIESYRLEIYGRGDDRERIGIVERFDLDPSVDTLPRPEWVDRALRNETTGGR